MSPKYLDHPVVEKSFLDLTAKELAMVVRRPLVYTDLVEAGREINPHEHDTVKDELNRWSLRHETHLLKERKFLGMPDAPLSF